MRPVDADAALARNALADIPGFAADNIGTAEIERLKGLTNLVFKVVAAGEAFCLRIPGPGTSAIIDRAAEAANARLAAAAGAAPPVLYVGADGVMLTPFIAEATALTIESIRHAGALERAGRALRDLHERSADFACDFDVFGKIANYLRLLRERNVPLDARVGDLLTAAGTVRAALEAVAARQRPCHCDPTPANLLDSGSRVWLVDWEYSGMNDPAWDLAYLSVMAGLDDDLDARLLAAYAGRAATEAEASRLALSKILCELPSVLWALVQHSGGNRAGDFLGYAETTLESARARVGSPDFEAHLRAVRGG